jgi:hypothetical protein
MIYAFLLLCQRLEINPRTHEIAKLPRRFYSEIIVGTSGMTLCAESKLLYYIELMTVNLFSFKKIPRTKNQKIENP